MITAVDTNVLLDVFGADPTHGSASADALRASLDVGRLVVGEVVWAETAASFPDPDAAATALATLGAGFSVGDQRAAALAGTAWRRYRRAGGPRTRVIADFLVGAHAATCADRLLSRDRGFFRTYFAELAVLDPGGPRPRPR